MDARLQVVTDQSSHFGMKPFKSTAEHCSFEKHEVVVVSPRGPGGVAYPPCRVDTKRMLSVGCISYASSPSSSQSASLISTRMPGRLQIPCVLADPQNTSLNDR